MPSSTNRVAQDAGFTVAELVMAAAILLTIVTASMTGLTFAAQSNISTMQKTEATTLANQQIEEIRSLATNSFDDVASTVPTGGLPGGKIVTPRTVGKYTITTNVAFGASNPNQLYARTPYKDVTVIVSWTIPSPGSVTLVTRVAGKDKLGLWNRGSVQTTVRDANTTLPLAGATVTLVDSTGDNYSVVTTGSGVAAFNFLPSGTITSLAANMSGYVQTDGPSSPISCVANQTTVLSDIKMKPAKTAIFTVQAPSARPLCLSTLGTNVTVTLSGPAPGLPLTANTQSDGTATFINLIAGSYTANVTVPTTYYNAFATPADTFTILDTNDTVNRTETASVKATTMRFSSTTSGSIYVWNNNGTAYINPATGSQLVKPLAYDSTQGLYTCVFTLTLPDDNPLNLQFNKSSVNWQAAPYINLACRASKNMPSSTTYYALN